MNIAINSHKKQHKILKSIYLNNLTRKTGFLYRLAKADKLADINSEYADLFAFQIDSLISLLDSLYADNWEILLTPYYSYGKVQYMLSILILYKSLTIENSRKETHKIENLIVTLKIGQKILNGYNLSFETVEGTRSKISFAEYRSEYFHSHFNTDYSNNLLHTFYFCLGQSELNDILLEIKNDNFDINTFELFFYTLNEFVRWESLEGVPYVYLENITEDYELTHTVSTEVNYNYQKFVSIFMEEILQNLSFLDLKYFLKDNRINVKQTKNFNKKLFQLFLYLFKKKYVFDKIFVLKRNNKYYNAKSLIVQFINLHTEEELLDVENLSFIVEQKDFKQDASLVSVYNNKRRNTEDNQLPYIYVKNKKLEFKISNPVGKVDISNVEINPKFINFITKIFSDTINFNIMQINRNE
jgi:hypothetical protein